MQRSAFSPSCTLGDRTCCSIHISTVSCPSAAFQPTTAIGCDRGIAFFLPLGVLEKVFRGKFLEGLKRAYRRRRLSLGGATGPLKDPKAFRVLLQSLHRKDWSSMSSQPWRVPKPVLRYLGRYTHRVAISNHRLVSFDREQVTFRWKDYAAATNNAS